MELANSIALLYLYYYLQNVIHYPRPGTGQLILVSVATGATILATVVIGRLARRHRLHARGDQLVGPGDRLRLRPRGRVRRVPVGQFGAVPDGAARSGKR